jgi:hypothetical protein
VEKCPKCGQWTFALDSRRGVLSCCRIECMHEEKVDVTVYLSKTNVLPILIQSLKLSATAANKIANTSRVTC